MGKDKEKISTNYAASEWCTQLTNNALDLASNAAGLWLFREAKACFGASNAPVLQYWFVATA